MPGSLRIFNTDPEGKKGKSRGKGIYYHRGKGIFSKYSVERDIKIHARGWKISPTGKLSNGKKSSIAQAGDGILPR